MTTAVATVPSISNPLRDRTALLGPEANGILMSPEEFDAVEDWEEGLCYELIRGVVIVNPIPVKNERDPNEELGHWLRTYRDTNPNGHSLDWTIAEEYVFLPDGSRRRADRLVWCGLGRLPDETVDVACIGIEFVSRRRRDWRRDFTEKRREYQAIGMREYWVIDRFRRQMTVFFVDGTERVVEDGEIYETSFLPGFQLPLGRLLQIANRWSSKK